MPLLCFQAKAQQVSGQPNLPPTLDQISDVGLCPTRDAQTIMLKGISPGPEPWQRTKLQVDADHREMFQSLEIHQLANGAGYIRFRPAANMYGTAMITVTVKDDGTTVNGGNNQLQRRFSIKLFSRPDVNASVETVDAPLSAGKQHAIATFRLSAKTSAPRASFSWFPADGIDAPQSQVTDLSTAITSGKTYYVTVTSEHGCKAIDSVVIDPHKNSQENITLAAAPNPVNHKTLVKFSIRGRDQSVTLEAFRPDGARAAHVYSGEVKANQIYLVPFDGSSLLQGVYYLRLATATSAKTLKLVVAH